MVKLGWELRRKAAPAAAKRLMRRALLCTPPRNMTRRRARKNAHDSFSQTDAMSFSLRTNVLVGVRISQPGNTFEAAKARRPLSDFPTMDCWEYHDGKRRCSLHPVCRPLAWNRPYSSK